MPTVGEIIQRLTPKGTLLQADDKRFRPPPNDPIVLWRDAPIWPPDMFAIVATLVRFSECYTHGSVRGGVGLGTNHAKKTQQIGRLWEKRLGSSRLDEWRNREWQVILAAWNVKVGDVDGKSGRLLPWAISALRLLAAADEASESVGFGRKTLVARMAEDIARMQGFATLTFAVDSGECCVQPKGRTPAVGCNLRSMSLHLALLPPASMVRAYYIDPIERIRHRKNFGVILVPFPYRVDDSEFSRRIVSGKRWGRLALKCSWRVNPTENELANFVVQIVRSAQSRRKRTDMLIFPELALRESQLRAIWRKVRGLGVQILLSGVHGNQREISTFVGKRANFAAGVFRGTTTKGDVYWFQPKHHRWRVDRGQIESYEFPLSAKISWWEDIAIDKRLVIATRFTAGATLACLVCEDLARVEPVQPVLREMGPSLLIALLMDGPQRINRWSARSATSFADDPGTSVLSVTSVGLVRRFQRVREKNRGCVSPSIALWQEPGCAPLEVPLAPNSHAVHFCLKVGEQTETTLDGRSDGGAAEVLRLVNPDSEPFAQIEVRSAPKWAVPLYKDH